MRTVRELECVEATTKPEEASEVIVKRFDHLAGQDTIKGTELAPLFVPGKWYRVTVEEM